MGRWQLEETAKLMMDVMRLNAKLLKGLKECRARGGPPRVRRCLFPRFSGMFSWYAEGLVERMCMHLRCS